MPCESITDNGTLGRFFLHASDVTRSEASSLLWNFILSRAILIIVPRNLCALIYVIFHVQIFKREH